MAYTCKCQCNSFREHALGVAFSGEAMPSRSNVKQNNDTEKQWEKDGNAYKRLHKEGYDLKSLDGAADFEKRATHKVELEHSKLYGENAATMQMLSDGNY